MLSQFLVREHEAEQPILKAASHKADTIRQVIKAVGAKLIFLPPYSPDLNPIEKAFSIIKHLLRNASERTVEVTWQRIGSILKTFSAEEC